MTIEKRVATRLLEGASIVSHYKIMQKGSIAITTSISAFSGVMYVEDIKGNLSRIRAELSRKIKMMHQLGKEEGFYADYIEGSRPFITNVNRKIEIAMSSTYELGRETEEGDVLLDDSEIDDVAKKIGLR